MAIYEGLVGGLGPYSKLGTSYANEPRTTMEWQDAPQQPDQGTGIDNLQKNSVDDNTYLNYQKMWELQRQQASAQYEKDLQAEKDRQVQSRLTDYFDNIKNYTDATDLSNQVADAKFKAGQDILNIDPAKGMGLITEAAKDKNNIVKNEIVDNKLKAQLLDYKGKLLGGVTNQAELDEARTTLANVGVDIPERYQTWNDDTKNWIKNQAVFSSAFMKKLNLDNAVANTGLRSKELTLKTEEEARKEKAAQVKETRLQNNVPVPKNDMNSYASETGYLSDDKRFSKVPTEKQMGIVDAITREAAAMMLKQGLSPEQAKQQAREKVLGNLDATGNYVLPKAATPSTQVAPEQALQALKANPSLAPQFKAKYGYLP